MPHQVLDIEAFCVETDLESGYFIQIEKEDEKIVGYIDNANIRINPSLYNRLEDDQRNRKKCSFSRHGGSHSMQK